MLTPYFVPSRRSLYRQQPMLNDKFKMSNISKAIFSCLLLFFSFSLASQAQNPDRLYVYTWLDANSDGLYQFPESGIPNLTVKLYNCNGNTPIQTLQTNAGGELWVSNLNAGQAYKISIDRPNAKFYTYENVGGDDLIDSDILKNGFSECFNIVANDTSELFAGFVDCPPVGSFKCSDLINVSLAPFPGCNGLIKPEDMLSSKTQCSNSFKVELSTLNGTFVPNPITSAYIGQTLMAVVKDTMYTPNQSCWGNVFVEYKIAPRITSCTGDTLLCYNANPPATALNYRPSFNSCNPSVFLTSKDREIDIPCTGNVLSGRFKRILERTWYARDTNGFKGKVMVDSCVQRFYFRAQKLSDVTFPSNLTLTCNTSFSPDANGNPTPTGVFAGPWLGGIFLWNNTTHPCMFNAIYTDQVVPMCKGSRKIIRSWRVVDWCTSEYRDGVQFIELIDDVKPNITCPSNVTISTDNSSCYGTLSVPTPNVSDNCSGEWKLSFVAPTGRVILNEIVTDLRVGSHTITWTAIDPCENTNTCSFTVVVRDQVAPIPVCDDNLVVTLDKVNGEAKIFAQSFDEGSTDNCGIRSYKVRRMGGCIGASALADSVRLVCCDVPNGVMVELVVTDSSGNFNSCMSNVTVQDKQAPTIVCPTSITVGCDDNRTPSQFGKVVTLGQKRDTFFINGQRVIDGLGFDNCNQVFITTTDSTIRDCGDGFIRRNFSIRDINNLTSSCQQIITIVNNNKFTVNDINWPAAYSTSNCAQGIAPDDLPNGFKRPTISGNRCGMMIVSEPEDVLFPVSAPACFKVYRKWRVIDMCQYRPNISATVGIWEYIQEIIVTDNQKPVFTVVPSSFNVDIVGTGCIGSATIPVPTITDCKPNIVASVAVRQGNTTVATGYGPHNLAVGTYTVIYTAEDGCGNASTASINFQVRDRKKPTPLAIKGLAIDLMPTTGQVAISADKFEAGSSDNCTAYANLSYRLGKVGTPGQTNPPSSASVTLTCADLGQTKIDFWVGDESGNWDYVTTFIDVQNNMGANCGPTGSNTANVTGTILLHDNGKPTENVEVGNSISNVIKGMTDVKGNYILNKLKVGNNVTVLPLKNDDWMNGVTTLDLVYINRHILGTEPFNSPYKAIAADVAKDDKITTLDLVTLRRLILGQIAEVSGNMSWRFINATHKFNDNNPFDEQCPSTCEINPLSADAVANFVAIKTGDVNGTAKANSTDFNTASDRSNATLVFETEDQELRTGQTYKVNFKAKASQLNVSGYQFSMNFDSKVLEFVDVNTKNSQDLSLANFGLSNVKEGAIVTSWNSMTNAALNSDEVLFEMTFKAKANNQLSNVLSIGSRLLSAEAYNLSNESMKIALQFPGKSSTFELYQNQPNPFKATTVIGFSLPVGGYAKLTVLDAAGRTLKVIDGDFAKGYNEVQLQANELQGIGVLYYRLDTSNGSATKKMVVLE